MAGRIWPEHLWLVRHGQSAGNVARDAAHVEGLGRITLDTRDVDVPLSSLGVAQSSALADWWARVPAAEQPTVIFCSPYRRARETAELLRAGVGQRRQVGWAIDERLREREFGILDGLTASGIAALHPQEAAARQRLGKFYHRPSGGESWCDVILRLRAVLDMLSLHHRQERVLIVAHQVVVLCFRYLLEGLSEEEVLGIDAQGDVANCGVTDYRSDDAGQLRLHRYNVVAPVRDRGMPVTRAPDDLATP